MQINTPYGKTELPGGHLPLLCEKCNDITDRVGPIAIFKPEDLKFPMTADMFKSIDEKHGFPHPFQTMPGRKETSSWEAARCPLCHQRPFNHRDRVLTPFGMFEIGGKAPEIKTQANENQKKIEQIWNEQDLSPDEIKQKIIEKEFAEKEEFIAEVPCPRCLPKHTELKTSSERTDWWECPVHGLVVTKADYPNVPESQDVEEDTSSKPLKELSEEIGTDVINEALEKPEKSPGMAKTVEDFREKHPDRCIYCGRQIKLKMALTNHEKACPDNPKNEKEEHND